MDYVGIDPLVGLECPDCRHVERLPYSELLNKALADLPICCSDCGTPLRHDWATVDQVQTIIHRRMLQMQSQAPDKTPRHAG